MPDKVIVDTSQIAEALYDATAKSRFLRQSVKNVLHDGAEIWKLVWDTSLEGIKAAEEGPHPYETGEYRDHIQVEELGLKDKLFIKKALRDKGVMGKIFNDDPKAKWLEEGTDVDKPGGHSPWGPNTKTPAFRVAARTAELMREGIVGK